VSEHFDPYRQYAHAILRMRDEGKPLWLIEQTFGVPRIRLMREFALVDEIKASIAASKYPKAHFVLGAEDKPVEMPCKVPSAMAVL
jgi:hypothetical protein